MKRTLLALMLVALLACPAVAQTVKLPAEVKVQPGRLAAVTVEWEGDDLRWDVPGDLDVFREYDPDPKKVRLRLIGYAAGTYRLIAIVCRGGRLSEFAVCTITVGTPPVPPGPNPPTPPGPNPPTPIPTDGFRVLIVEETTDRGKLPKGQADILSSTEVRGYLNAKCAKGPDGKTPEWRIFDKDTDTGKESLLWQGVMKLPRQSLPWIIIGDGRTGYQGPLPATVAETMALLRKYGG